MIVVGSANLSTPKGARPLFRDATTLNSLQSQLLAFSNNNPRPISLSIASSSSVYSPLSGVREWSLESWKSKKAHQIPEYPNPEELRDVLDTLHRFPPVVFAGEARRLEEWLGKAAMGEAFLLQGGDCAESFKEFNADNIRDTFRVFLQMAITLIYGAQMPVIKVFFFFSKIIIFC